MVKLGGPTGVLLVAGLVALATVPAAPLDGGAAVSASDDALRSSSAAVEREPVPQQSAALQETTESETTTRGDEAEADHAVSPLSFPERPASLNESNVLRYVAAYEQARNHNEILEGTTDVSITSIDVLCSPTSLDEQADGFAVEVACGFSYEFGEDGTATGIADGAPYAARYLVSENATELRGLWSGLGTGAALPLPFPEKPEPLDGVSAVPFTTNYEEVRKHNELLNETDATVTGAEVHCQFDRIAERDSGFLVDVSCDFSYWFRTEGGTGGIVHGAPYTARYRVNETATELVGVEVVGGNATTAADARTTTAAGGGTTTADGNETEGY